MNTQVENINASNFEEKHILNLTNEEKNKLYFKLKRERIKNSRKNLIKFFGEIPLFFFSLLGSLSLTYNIFFYFILFDDLKLGILYKFGYIEPFYTIFVITISIGLFIVIFFIFSFSIILYKKYLELSKNDNIDKKEK